MSAIICRQVGFLEKRNWAMRKSVLGISVLVLSTFSAFAADLPVKAPVAPEIVPTWAGWYVGLNGGGVWAGVSPTSTVLNNSTFPAGTRISEVEAAGSTSFDRSAALVGGQFGYLGQWGNVVAGVEAGVDWTAIHASKSIPAFYQACPNPTGCAFVVNRGFNSDWLFTLLGRAGMAWGPVLPYITGGLAVSNLRYSYAFIGADLVNPNGFARGAVSTGSTRTGFAIGGGVDWQVDPHWSVRAEYLYVQFDALSANTPTLAPPASTTTISVSSGQINENIARIAVSYRFGGGGSSPLTAMAADLPVKALPPPAPVASWTGLYAGADAGAAWSHSGDWTFFDPNPASVALGPPLIVAPTLGARTSPVAAIVGFHAGYNWQFAPTWVLGIEGDYSWSNLSENRTETPLALRNGAGVVNPTSNTSLTMKTDTRGLASVRGRLGYVGWANTLFYATGGVAWEQEHFTGVENNISPTFATNFLSVANTGKTSTGWVAGAGAEMMMTSHFLVRAEYLYYGFNSGATAQANIQPNPGAFPLPFIYNWASQNIQTVRVGFSYKL
jgi:outer membrane immunogenic protein